MKQQMWATPCTNWWAHLDTSNEQEDDQEDGDDWRKGSSAATHIVPASQSRIMHAPSLAEMHQRSRPCSARASCWRQYCFDSRTQTREEGIQISANYCEAPAQTSKDQIDWRKQRSGVSRNEREIGQCKNTLGKKINYWVWNRMHRSTCNKIQ